MIKSSFKSFSVDNINIAVCKACRKIVYKDNIFNLKDYIKYPIGYMWVVCATDTKYKRTKIDAPLATNVYLCENCLNLTLNDEINFIKTNDKYANILTTNRARYDYK